MRNSSERIRGGLWGLLIGDAVGVPYEFHPSHRIPSYDEIEMVPPLGYDRTYPELEPGTWSDDGAQALCLLDSLLANGRLQLNDFAQRLTAWDGSGLWAVDGYVFDRGIQTMAAIERLRAGVSPTRSGFIRPEGKGNGALMRVLPLALWHRGEDSALIEDAHLQSVVTHGHVTNQVCSALYCLWARRLLTGMDTESAYGLAVKTLREQYGSSSEYRKFLESEVRPDEPPVTDGNGYVVSTLHAARLALQETTYEAVVKVAIAFGNDTDTNAAVAGGLAGVRDGVGAIPERWMRMLRGKEQVGVLLTKWLGV